MLKNYVKKAPRRTPLIVHFFHFPQSDGENNKAPKVHTTATKKIVQLISCCPLVL